MCLNITNLLIESLKANDGEFFINLTTDSCIRKKFWVYIKKHKLLYCFFVRLGIALK